jgi:hypothetical protein
MVKTKMTYTQQCKGPMRLWLKKYSDERLAALLAHAQSGRLHFQSCCCFIGSINATHPLRIKFEGDNWFSHPHLKLARQDEIGQRAELAFKELLLEAGWQYSSGGPLTEDIMSYGRRIVVALCKSEFKQREWARKKAEQHNEAEEHSKVPVVKETACQSV